MAFCSSISASRNARSLLAVLALLFGQTIVPGGWAGAEEPDVKPIDQIDALSNGLAAFAMIRDELGLGPSPLYLATIERSREHAAQTERFDIFSGMREVSNGTGQSLIAAICHILEPEALIPGLNCLEDIGNLDELTVRLLEQQQMLLAAAEEAGKLHERAYDEFVDNLFEQVVCRVGSEICGEDREETREWWQESGQRALMVLDRIGREHIKLTERLGDEAIENARDHVFARLVNVLAREDVKIVVRVLKESDSSRFGSLLNAVKDRTRALESVSAVSGWIKTTIAERFERALAALPKETEGLSHINAALTRAKDEASDRLEQAGAEAAQHESVDAVEALEAGFQESRQRLVEIVVAGKALGEATSCSLSDPALAMGLGQSPPPPTPVALGEAVQGLMGFLETCKQSAERGIEGLTAALSVAKPAAPTPVAVAQAVCRFNAALTKDVAPLRELFVKGLSATAEVTLQLATVKESCEIVSVLPARLEAAQEYLDLLRTRVLEEAQAAGTEAETKALDGARQLVVSSDAAARVAIGERLDAIADELWAASRLLVDDTMLDFEVVDVLGTCAAPKGPLALGWQLQAPRFEEAGDELRLTFSADIALCKPMEKRRPVEADEARLAKSNPEMVGTVGATWRFARAKGSVSVKLGGLFRPGGKLNAQAFEKAVVTLRERLMNSAKVGLEIDKESLHRHAEAELKERTEPITEAAVDELLRTRFVDAVRRIMPLPGLRHRLHLAKLRYEIAADSSVLEVRVPLEIDALGLELKICIAVPLRDGAAISSGEDCHDVLEIDNTLWDEIERQLHDTVLARLREEAEGRLGPYTNLLGERLAELGPKADGVSLAIDLAHARLLMEFPNVLKSGTALPSPLVANDFAGELVLLLDLSDGAVSVSALPQLDLESLAQRVYPALADVVRPILSLQPLEQSSSTCDEAPGVGLAFGSALSIEGRLGALCWRSGQLEFAPPTGGSFGGFALSLPAARLRLLIDAGGAELREDSPTVLRLDGTLEAVGTRDPWGLRDAGLGIVLDIDLGTNTVSISEDAPGNAALYAHLRARALAWLPQGASIARIEISSSGIDLKVMGLEEGLYDAAFERFFSDDSLQAITNWLADQEPTPDACLALRAGAVGEMLRRMAMPGEAAQTALSDCPFGIIAQNSQLTSGAQRASNALHLPQQIQPVLEWECKDGPDASFRSCLLRLPQFKEYCGNFRIELSQGADFAANGQPTVRPIGSQRCLEKQLAALMPPGLEQFRPHLPDELTLDCPDGAGISDCAVIAVVQLSFDALGERLSDLPKDDSCGDPPALEFDATLRIGIDGSVRPGNDLRTTLSKLGGDAGKHTLCRLTGVVGEAAADAAAEALTWLETLRQELATALQEGTQWASFTCRAVFARPVDGAESALCTAYGADTLAPALLSQPPSAIVFTRSIVLFDTEVQIDATLPLAEGRLGPATLGLDCAGCDARMAALADKIANTMTSGVGKAVSYKGGASLTIADETMSFSAPFELEIEQLGVSSTFRIDCSLRVFERTSLSCGGKTPEHETLIAGAVATLLKERLAGEGIVVPMGPLEGRVSGATHEGSLVFLAGDMAIPGMEPPIAMRIALPLFGNAFRVEFDEKDLEDTVGRQITDQLNALFGGAVPLTISKVVPERSEDGSGKLTGLRISSNASIEGLFTISVPDVLLTENGLKVDEPSELAIGFPPDLQIPVPPVTICPTGGILGAERLVILASVTTLECTAETMLAIKGRAEINLRTPGIFKLRGDMVLLGFLTLGYSEAELNVRELYFDSVLDIGGPVSDIVSYRSTMRVEGGDNPHARTRDKLSLFRVPVNDQSVYIDFKKGAVDAELSINLFGVITGNGVFGMDSFGGNPRSNVDGSAQIAGLTLGSLKVRAKPNIAKASFNVLGFKLTVVVPGLDSLTPGYLADIIKNLLTPNFKDLDKALLALFSGNITINPIAKFGSGGDGSMNGSDGEESGADGDDGTAQGEPSTGSEGLGEGAAEAAPPPPGTPDADKVSAEGSSPGNPSKLNPPGQFHIDLAVGDPKHAVNLMEGPRLDTEIAAVPNHPLIDSVFAQKAGVGLFFTKETYVHLGDAQVTDAADVTTCTTGQVGPVVFTFAGVDTPKVGYFEICRMRVKDGQAIRAMKQDELTVADYAELVRPFLTGLAAFPGAMPDLIGEEGAPKSWAPERTLLTGFRGKVTAGSAGEVRIIAGMPRAGRLLVVTDMPGAADENTPCTATPEIFGERQIRAFVLDVPERARPLDRKELELLGDALAGLAACGSGRAAIYEITGRKYISAEGNLGGWDKDSRRYRMIRERDPESEQVEVPPDPMLAAIEAEAPTDPSTEFTPPPLVPPPEELEAKIVEVLKAVPAGETSSQGIPILRGSATSVWLQLLDRGSNCLARWSDGQRITAYSPDEIGGSCAPERVIAVASAMDVQGGTDPKDREHLLLLELQPDGSASHLIHLGWGAGERMPIGPQWQHKSALAAFEAVESYLPSDQPLRLLGPIGFEAPIEGAAAGPAALPFEGGDGLLRLVWGADTGRGALVLPKGLELERVTRLPGLLAGLGTDKALPPPQSIREAAVLHESPDRLILRDHDSPFGRIQPVITWLSEESRWHLMARVIETPPAADTTRAITAALLDKRLADQNPADPVSDVWLFRLTPSQIGYAYKSPTGSDEIFWRESEWNPGAVPEDLLQAIEQHLSDAARSALYELCYIGDQVVGAGIGASKILEFIDSKRPLLLANPELSAEALRRLYIAGVLDVQRRAGTRTDCGSISDSEASDSPNVNSAEYANILDTKLGIRLDGEPEAPDTDAFSKYQAKIAGFHALHAPDACQAVARALLALAVDGTLGERRMWRPDGSCAPGTVLLLKGGDGEVTAIHEQIGGGFVHKVEIEGDALPEMLLVPFREAFPTSDRDVALQLTGHLVPISGRDPAWAAQDDNDTLRILLTEGGDPKVIEIEGLNPGDIALDALIGFAIDSRGERFVFQRVWGTDAVLMVENKAGERWLVTLGATFEPIAWVALDGEGPIEGPALETLALMLKAAQIVEERRGEGSDFAYEVGASPAIWTVASSGTTVAMRPFKDGPYFLFTRESPDTLPDAAVLCAPRLSTAMLLDLAERTRKDFARRVADTGALADRLAEFAGKSCDEGHPGVVSFAPSSAGSAAGLVHGIDTEARLLVAAYSPCDKPDGCALEAESTGPGLPDEMRKGLLAVLRSSLMREDGSSSQLRVLYDSALADGSSRRRLLLGWFDPDVKGAPGPGDRLLYADQDPLPGENLPPCLSPPIPVRFNTGRMETLETIDPGLLETPAEKLRDYLSQRLGERLLARLEGRDTSGAAACVALGALRPFIIIDEEGPVIFEEERAALPDALRSEPVKLVMLGWTGLGMSTMASAGSTSAELFVSKDEGKPATLRFPADLDLEERGSLYSAVKGYLKYSESAAVAFSPAAAAELTILTAPFDAGTVLAVNIVGTETVALRLDLPSEGPAPPPSVLRRAIAAHGGPPLDRRLPAPLMLAGGARGWIVAESAPPFKVWPLESDGAEPLGELGDDLAESERRNLLARVADDPSPFCARVTRSEGVSSRLWHRRRSAEPDCKLDEAGITIHRWGLYALGEWHAVETALAPHNLNADAILHLIPAIGAPAGAFVHVMAAPLQGTVLALMTACTGTRQEPSTRQPADPAALHDLRRLDGEAKEIAMPLSAHGACVLPGDLAAVLGRKNSPAARESLSLDILPSGAGAGSYAGISLPTFKAEFTNRRVVGFNSRAVQLQLTRSDAMLPCEDTVASDAADTVDWPGAIAAFVAAHPEEGALAHHRRPWPQVGDRGYLIVAPASNRGWLVAGLHAVVEVGASPGEPVSWALMAVPSSVTADSCAGTLAARLLAKLHEIRGSPGTADGWPAELLEFAPTRLLAAMPDVHLAILSDAGQEATVSVETSDLGPSAGEWSAESVARSSLDAALVAYADLPLSRIAFFQPTSGGPVTVAVSLDDGAIDGLGYLEPTSTMQTVKFDVAEPVPFARARLLAEAVDEESQKWRAPWLFGSGASLRFCDEGQPKIRLPAMYDLAVPLLQIDLALWRDGEPFDCAELKGAPADVLITALRPGGAGGESAIVLVTASIEGLLAHDPQTGSNGNRHFALFRAGAEASGCRSRLEGQGAAALAAAVLADTNLLCTVSAEFPEAEGPATGAAFVSREAKIGLVLPGCKRILEPNMSASAVPHVNAAALKLYWDRLGAEDGCPTKPGVWLALRDKHFARLAGRFREMESGATVHLQRDWGAEPTHDVWLASWLRSPGITELAVDSRLHATAAGAELVDVAIDRGAGRFLLTENSCTAFAPPLDDRSMALPDFARDLAPFADPPYRCDRAVVTIAVPERAVPLHAVLELDTTDVPKCFMALVKAAEPPENCVKDFVLSESSGAMILAAGADAELGLLLALLVDARDKAANARSAALSFLRALAPRWTLLHTSWHPNYDFLLAGANDPQLYRVNVIDGRCNQITAVQVTDAVRRRGFTSEGCGGSSLSECALLRVIEKLPGGGKRPSEPLWYAEYFNGDPRNVLLSEADLRC